MEGGGGGETPPAEMFKNVPRRARSNSGDSRRRGGGSGAARTRGEDGPPAVQPSAGREEERPEDAQNGGGGALGGLFPEEDLEDDMNDGDFNIEDYLVDPYPEHQEEDAKKSPPAPSRTDEASSASSGREEPADWAEKMRIRKGKMPAANNDDDDDAAAEAGAPGPGGGGGDGGGKLMGDAIRSHGGAAAAFSEMKPSKSKKRKDPPFWYGLGSDGQSTSTAGSNTDYSFDKIDVVRTGLRTALAGVGLDLGAAAPRRVYGRMLSSSDRRTSQARLQISFKSWGAELDEHPLYAFLTKAEKEEVAGKGLEVKSYDRGGQVFDLKFRYLKSNNSFRIIGKWGSFLRENGLAVVKGRRRQGPKDVMLDLWLFRPPTGKVGMVVLHYYKGDAAHAEAAFNEVGRRTRARRDGADDAAEDEPPPSPPEPDEGGGAGGNNDAAAMEDVAGDAGEEGQDDAGVNGGAAAEAPSPSDQPDGGAPTEAAAAESSSEAGGAASKVGAPGEADGTKTEEKEASAPTRVGGAASKAGAPGEADGTKTEEKEASAPTRVAAAQSSSSDKLEAAPPSTADAGVPEKATKQGLQALLQRSGLNCYDVLGAFALLLISRGL